MNQPIVLVLCISTIIMVLYSTFAKTMIRFLMATWFQAFFVSGILFELGFEYVGLITFLTSSLSIVFLSVYSGTLVGDLRNEFKKISFKKVVVLGLISILITSGLMGLVYLTGSQFAINSDGSSITTEAVGGLLLTNHKTSALMMAILVMTVLLGSSLTIYFSDRDKQ